MVRFVVYDMIGCFSALSCMLALLGLLRFFDAKSLEFYVLSNRSYLAESFLQISAPPLTVILAYFMLAIRYLYYICSVYSLQLHGGILLGHRPSANLFDGFIITASIETVYLLD